MFEEKSARTPPRHTGLGPGMDAGFVASRCGDDPLDGDRRQTTLDGRNSTSRGRRIDGHGSVLSPAANSFGADDAPPLAAAEFDVWSPGRCSGWAKYCVCG